MHAFLKFHIQLVNFDLINSLYSHNKLAKTLTYLIFIRTSYELNGSNRFPITEQIHIDGDTLVFLTSDNRFRLTAFTANVCQYHLLLWLLHLLPTRKFGISLYADSEAFYPIFFLTSSTSIQSRR